MAGLSVRRPCHQVRSNCVKSVTNREIGKHLCPLCHPSGAAGARILLYFRRVDQRRKCGTSARSARIAAVGPPAVGSWAAARCAPLRAVCAPRAVSFPPPARRAERPVLPAPARLLGDSRSRSSSSAGATRAALTRLPFGFSTGSAKVFSSAMRNNAAFKAEGWAAQLAQHLPLQEPWRSLQRRWPSQVSQIARAPSAHLPRRCARAISVAAAAKRARATPALCRAEWSQSMESAVVGHRWSTDAGLDDDALAWQVVQLRPQELHRHCTAERQACTQRDGERCSCGVGGRDARRGGGSRRGCRDSVSLCRIVRRGCTSSSSHYTMNHDT